MDDTYLSYTELFCRIQAERARLGLPLLKNSASLGGRLHKLRRTGERLHRRYSLADALRVYTRMEPWHPPTVEPPRHRGGNSLPRVHAAGHRVRRLPRVARAV